VRAPIYLPVNCSSGECGEEWLGKRTRATSQTLTFPFLLDIEKAKGNEDDRISTIFRIGVSYGCRLLQIICKRGLVPNRIFNDWIRGLHRKSFAGNI
jgi:hypothetical protein